MSWHLQPTGRLDQVSLAANRTRIQRLVNQHSLDCMSSLLRSRVHGRARIGSIAEETALASNAIAAPLAVAAQIAVEVS